MYLTTMHKEELAAYLAHLTEYHQDLYSFMDMCAVNDVFIRKFSANPLVGDMDRFIQACVNFGILIDKTAYNAECIEIAYAPNKMLIKKLLKDPELIEVMLSSSHWEHGTPLVGHLGTDSTDLGSEL